MGEHFWYCDSRKAEAELGFTARDAQETLFETVRWLEENVRTPDGAPATRRRPRPARAPRPRAQNGALTALHRAARLVAHLPHRGDAAALAARGADLVRELLHHEDVGVPSAGASRAPHCGQESSATRSRRASTCERRASGGQRLHSTP